MEFSEKYTSATDKEPGKKIISDDAFALGGLLEAIVKKLEHLRVSGIFR